MPLPQAVEQRLAPLYNTLFNTDKVRYKELADDDDHKLPAPAAFDNYLNPGSRAPSPLLSAAAKPLRRVTPPRPRLLSILVFLLVVSALLVPGSWFLMRWPFSRKEDYSNAGKGTKALVIASFVSQDVSWLELIPTEWKPYRYIMDEPQPINGLPVPRNRGREAMAYLTFIIDNYDNLPDYMMFTHGHLRSWHQVEPLNAKIRALNFTALEQEQYISLRCGDQMGCERRPYLDTENVGWELQRGIREFWHAIVPGEDLPHYLSHKCCAQFAVTKAAVKKRPKSAWEQIRQPLMDDLEQNKDTDWGKMPPFLDDWIIGMWYEKFWHLFFGMGAHYCPSLEHCRMVHFSNAITCDQGIDTSPFDGDGWNETVCVSAFDNVPPDEPVDLNIFHDHLGEYDAQIRGGRWERIAAEKGYNIHPTPPENKLEQEEQKGAEMLELEVEANAAAAPPLTETGLFGDENPDAYEDEPGSSVESSTWEDMDAA